MISGPAVPAPVSTDGGDGRRTGGPGGRRRARNRRYHRNRSQRSLLHIVCWNADGLQPKVNELERWLLLNRADVVAIQEGQFSRSTPRLSGFQPPVVTRRARGRIDGAQVKGGDVALYIRAGVHFVPLTDRPLAANDDSTEICGVKILGVRPLDIWCLYRPPLRTSAEDQRVDHFNPALLSADVNTIVVGDFNAHHPSWDNACDAPDAVGDRVAAWLDRVGWTTLNSGEATRVDSQTAPDLAACSTALARRSTWELDDSLGSDHRVMRISVRSGYSASSRVRKPRWAFKKADWPAWVADCEAALSELPATATAQELCSRFTVALQEASARHIPRGARAAPKPWAADPELEEAIADRRAAQARVDPADPATKERWIAARQRAAEVEARVSRQRFHDLVTEELNRPNNIGKVSRILKRWEGATDDEHRDGQAMEHKGRLLTKDREKSEAFCQTYAWVSRQVRDRKVDRRAKQLKKTHTPPACLECGGARLGCCGAFSMDELVRELQSLKLKKTPGPDGITAEMLVHLGPVSRSTLLRVINASWLEGVVPQEWRRATICPIPKAGKDKRKIASYRPIALTSHLSKLAERLILSRLNHTAAERNLIPPEQVGFREGRSVEDSLGRLVQQVQDGWQRPRSRKKSPADGETAQRYVLTAYDFSRAYDTVDHRLLRVRLLQQGVPLCIIAWVWSFLRDRRAHTEVNGCKSRDRIFRAGLPQGSVLAPTLFLLWSAPLADALRRIPGTTPYMYADDTAALCSGNTIAVAKRRAQRAADALVQWARASKMIVASDKTQVLVLSQAPKDAVDCTIRVAGEAVSAGPHLKLLGVTLDRTLHFGAHCKNLRQKTRPRIAHLKRLTGRDWGLREPQLRAVANGYVRGPQEHAAAAWLPATPASHVEVLEREVRAAARVVTGCPISTPVHALLAEAGLPPVSSRCRALAARFLAKARALPLEDPLRAVADTVVAARLSSVTGWRDVGQRVWEAVGMTSPIEPILPRRPPPWTAPGNVTFRLDVGPGLPPGASAQKKLEVATHHLAGLPQCATWVWTDGAADGGVHNGGAGALIEMPDGETCELRVAAGHICSSYRAELVALNTALVRLAEQPTHIEDPVVLCTDSQAALRRLRRGPSVQTSPLAVDIWNRLLELTSNGRHLYLQWIPSHCGVPGNERADVLAKDATALPQEEVPVDVTTIYRAAAREARSRFVSDRPAGWYATLMERRLPPPVRRSNRLEAIDIHQLRAGHWSGSAQYLHRIGRRPSPSCAQCNDLSCRAGWCLACGEEADTPDHVLLRCPALMVVRHRLLGNISPLPGEVRRDDVVAVLAGAARYLQSR